MRVSQNKPYCNIADESHSVSEKLPSIFPPWSINTMQMSTDMSQVSHSSLQEVGRYWYKRWKPVYIRKQRGCCKIQNIQWTYMPCQSLTELIWLRHLFFVYLNFHCELRISIQSSSLNINWQVEDISSSTRKQVGKWCKIQNSNH